MKIRRVSFSFLNILALTFLCLIPIGKLQAAATTFCVDDASDGSASPGDCDADCTDGMNNCSLRDAITAANTNSGTDTIIFKIPGNGVHTIQPTSALPDITDPVIIDGYSQTGASPNTNGPGLGSNAVLLIELNGSSLANTDGLTITAGNSTVRGLVINRFGTGGVFGSGISLETNGGNKIEGNFIGTDSTGTSSLGNVTRGVFITSDGNTIGGTDLSARNLISGNGERGVFILGVNDNVVQGNLIGTDISGTVDLGNGDDGVHIQNGSTNQIGGVTPEAGNVISGNDNVGVRVIQSAGSATGNQIQANFIGTDVTGTQKLKNGFLGVSIEGASNTLIGGTVSGARNVISGNSSSGIQIDGDTATGNQVMGNFIGSDITGTVNLANNSNGIGIGSGSNTIGGTTPGARNLIVNGINLFLGSHDTVVQGNFVGTDVTGTQSLGSVGGGIFIFTSNNTIGGTAPGAGNVIAFNQDFGIATANNAGPGNAILGNSIFSNNGLGIDLLQDGITANDAGDGDTGPNNLQNFPDLISAVSANGSTTIQGTLDSTAGGNFRIEFFSNDACDGSGNGEGQTFLGSADVTNGNFNAVLPVVLSNQLFITATATNNATQDTSEFSKCLQATVLVENCTNGADDDGDNLADCADPDCASDPACAPKTEICDNGTDDDGDGLIDCADPDCAGSPTCGNLESGGCRLGDGSNSSGSLAALLFPALAVIAMALRRKRS